MKKTLTIKGIEGMTKAAQQVLEICKSDKKFAFYGDLGAGKTTLIQDICLLLNSKDNVSSPTFSLVNEYDYPQGMIFHMDLYRLKTIEEALDIGIEGYLDSGQYCFIEWPDIILPLLDDGTIHIQINALEDATRMIEISRESPHSNNGERL
ncbi:MAG: tRNA (adenosine(37)-N6)-threonylcarbamoyltransferase complex ATPase subunit type 1 TsaE [Bacteroidota bacterium]